MIEHCDLISLERRQDECEKRQRDLEKKQKQLEVTCRDVEEMIENKYIYLFNKIYQWRQNNRAALERYKDETTQVIQSRKDQIEKDLDGIRQERECLAHSPCDSGIYISTDEDSMNESQDYDDNSSKCTSEIEIKDHSVLMMCTGKEIEDSMLGGIHIEHIPTNDYTLEDYNIIDYARPVISFQTRHDNVPSRYSASGLSLYKNDQQTLLLITDMGLNRVTVFDLHGKLCKLCDMAPYSYPSKAVHFGKFVGVVCDNSVRIYDRDFKLLGFLDDDCMDSPRAITVNKEERPEIADVRVRGCIIQTYHIEIIQSDNETKGIKSHPMTDNIIIGGHRCPSISQPRYMCHDKQGRLYVSDYKDHSIKVFNQRGALVQEVGSYGSDTGQLCNPGGICVDKFNNLIIADSMNYRIQMYIQHTKHWIVLIHTDHEAYPVDVTINDEDNSFIVLHANGRVTVYKYL